MTAHPSLFDSPHLASGDFQTIQGVVRSFATSGHPFCAEQVRDALPAGLQDRLKLVPNAFGMAFRRILKSGLLLATGDRVVASRREARGRTLPLYVGNPRKEY